MKTSNIILSTILVLFMCSCQEKIEKNTIDILKHSSIDTLVLGATKPYSKEHTHLLQKLSIEINEIQTNDLNVEDYYLSLTGRSLTIKNQEK